VVEVRDTGPGISPEEIGRIFERFHVSRRPGERGSTGLGLALARKIAAAHGGRIDVDSGRGEGSLLTVRLPLATA
jgi:signal transduction histidine kinase